MVEIHVRHHRHPAIPGMGGVEASTEPDLDEGDVDPDLGEPQEDHGREELELGRVALPPRHPVGDRADLGDQPGEGHRVDRAPVDLEPLAIGDEVGLGRLAHPQAGRTQHRPGQREHAALAVRAGHERAPERPLRIAELAQDRPRPAEPQPDAEPAALLERADGRPVRVRGGHTPPHPLVRHSTMTTRAPASRGPTSRRPTSRGPTSRGRRSATGRPSVLAQVVLVEDALVEAGGEADVVHVALLHVDAAAQLAAADVGVLADECLEQMRVPGSGSRRASRSCRSGGRRCAAGSAGRSRRAA